MKPGAIFLAALLALAAAPALANPCGFDERGRMVVVGYAVGATAVPADQKPKLAEFAETAKFRNGICVFAQVDAQGSKEANIRVADGRAEAVRTFLVSKGVRPDAIRIGTQEKGFTLFGLLKEDQDDDRRVYVTHD
jgi:outer membrane protein OmpA-like peptidoglycan-associated protein